jgi:hypothetical protein
MLEIILKIYSAPSLDVNLLQKEWGLFRCTKSGFASIYNIIIPFCNQHPILGVKAKDYSDWVKAAEIINKGDHLTTDRNTSAYALYALNR